MSYDVSMLVAVETDVLDVNVTYNLSPMFCKALGAWGMRSLNLLTGKEAEAWVDRAAQHMEQNADQYKPLNPDNGWGTYEVAVKTLRRIHEKCMEFPEGIIKVT